MKTCKRTHATLVNNTILWHVNPDFGSQIYPILCQVIHTTPFLISSQIYPTLCQVILTFCNATARRSQMAYLASKKHAMGIHCAHCANKGAQPMIAVKKKNILPHVVSMWGLCLEMQFVNMMCWRFVLCLGAGQANPLIPIMPLLLRQLQSEQPWKPSTWLPRTLSVCWDGFVLVPCNLG